MKTNRSAIAVVPPEDVWGPIQAIRSVHDRAYARWMPHVNLLYPFLGPDAPAEGLERAAASVEPFDAVLGAFRTFDRKRGESTLWLAPESLDRFVALHSALEAAHPECFEGSRHPGGFHPHLSVGQAGSPAERDRLLAEFSREWRPVRFRVDSIAWLVRGDDTPFSIGRRVTLGGGQAAKGS